MTIIALTPYFHWLLAFHTISFTAWMVGMFYMPYLFVYHSQTVAGSAESERFKVMEAKLMGIVMNPGMIATWVFGLALILTPSAVDWHAGWWWTKFIAVILMSGMHGALSKWRKDFLSDRRVRSERFYRMSHQVPAVLFIVIVLAAVVFK